MSLRSYLASEQRGSTAIESVILFPLCFVTILGLLYFLFFCLAYINYSNTATLLAHRFNMGRDGYDRAYAVYPYAANIPVVWTSVLGERNVAGSGEAYRYADLSTSGGYRLQSSDVHIYSSLDGDSMSNNQYVRAALYAALDSHGSNQPGEDDDRLRNHLVMPFTQITGIDVRTSRDVNFHGKTGTQATAGIVVQVNIHFRTLNPLGTWNGLYRVGSAEHAYQHAAGQSALLSVHASGYDVIS